MSFTFRFGQRSGNSRSPWEPFASSPGDTSHCPDCGYSVVTPTRLVSSALSDRATAILNRVRDGERSGDISRELSEVLAKCPWLDANPVDFDTGGEITHAESLAAAREFQRAWFEVSGEHMSLAWSSGGGPGKPGIHGELGALSEPSFDAHKRLGKRCEAVARSLGYSETTNDWLHPVHGEAFKVDRRRFNHRVESRGGVTRAMGGDGKKHGQRKVAIDSHAPSVIDVARLPEVAPEPVYTPRERKPRQRRPVLASRYRDGRANATAKCLRDLFHRPGDNHLTRLALSRVAIESDTFDAPTWIGAMGFAFGDRHDAENAWRSTTERMDSGRAVAGAPRLQVEFGPYALHELSKAVAADTGAPLAKIERRLWGTANGRVLAKGFEVLLRSVKLDSPENLAQWKRQVSGQHCGDWCQKADCTQCALTRHRHRVRCANRANCRHCALRWADERLAWLESQPAWTSELLWVNERVYDTIEAAKRAIAGMSRGTWKGSRPLAVKHPTRDGRCCVLFIVPESARAAVVSPAMRGRKKVAWPVVRDRLFTALIAQHLLVNETARTDPAAALAHARYWYRRQEATGDKCLEWASQEELRAQSATRAAEAKREGVDCLCPHSVPVTWSVEHARSGRLLIEGAEHPLTLGQVAALAERPPPVPAQS